MIAECSFSMVVVASGRKLDDWMRLFHGRHIVVDGDECRLLLAFPLPFVPMFSVGGRELVTE